MSLSIKDELHPWLRIRIQFLEDLVTFYGGVFIYFSGFRTFDEQRALLDEKGIFGRPVADPGCSQHNHFSNGEALAVDVGITGPITDELMAFGDFNNAIDEIARAIGLVTVAKDPGHFQVFPGSEFRSWATQSGFCVPPLPGWDLALVKASNDQYRECLLEAVRANARGDRARRSCPVPCGPLFGVPC